MVRSAHQLGAIIIIILFSFFLFFLLVITIFILDMNLLHLSDFFFNKLFFVFITTHGQKLANRGNSKKQVESIKYIKTPDTICSMKSDPSVSECA